MSDTPRTDTAFAVQGELIFQRDQYVMADFARQLERELVKMERENAALRNEVVRLNNQTMWICSCGGTDCAGQQENAALRAVIFTQSSLLKRWLELADQQSETLDPMTYITFQKKDGLVGDTHSVLNTLNESKNT